MTAPTLTCDYCESEIDVAKDPRCVVYSPSSGATAVICAECQERSFAQAGCGDLNEPFRIKRRWQA
jgi:hypothetical protein